MNIDKWNSFYNMYVRVMENTINEIEQMKKFLFGDKMEEPHILDGNGLWITGSEYCSFVSDMLKVAYPLIQDEGDAFKTAGMDWLYSYARKVKPYNDMRQLETAQRLLFANIKQAHTFIQKGWEPGNGQVNEMRKEYLKLCEGHPDIYSFDSFPF